jgi:mono/diheme cytochrome c family protein
VDNTHAIWAPDPGLCDHVEALFGVHPPNPAQDGNVAVVEVAIGSVDGSECSTGFGGQGPNCGLVEDTGIPGGADFFLCGSLDGDGDFSVSLPGAEALPGQSPFCTTPDCVEAAQNTLATTTAVPVPMSAATDARDHWLAPGEPHCADCHAAPYVEQSGNINPFPPFNYPRKASLNRYSRGHQDLTCQACHESIHGLYPVTPPDYVGPGTKAIDTTSYAQAAQWNADGSHGPLKCGACHQTNDSGVYVNPDNRVDTALEFRGTPIDNDFDAAVSWMHTFTGEVDPADYICERCHGDNRLLISSTNGKWVDHTFDGRVTRTAMDNAEVANQGHVSGDPAFEDPEQTVCKGCHGDRTNTLQRKGCTTKWKNHLVEGRASDIAWETVTADNIGAAADGTLCGW